MNCSVDQQVSDESDVPVTRGAEDGIECAPQGSRKRYWISSNVFVCSTPNGTVLLDLVRDKYIGIADLEAAALEAVVHDWPKAETMESRLLVSSRSASNESSPNEIADLFVAAGLLTQDQEKSNTVLSVCLDLDQRLLSLGLDITVDTSLHAVDLLNFIGALISAYFSLKLKPLHSLVAKVRARRENNKVNSDLPFDPVVAAELTSKFRRMRPYAFAAKGNCMLHALTLGNFLARYGLYPFWIFGVRAAPFYAHCWIQMDSYIFDASPEQVSQYTRILSC